MSQRETSPKLVVLNTIVLSISAGANHSCIIANMAPRNMFTFGMNANGQLGHDDQVDRCEPIAISHLDDRLIVSAGCGLAHTVACSNHGDVLVWGNGRSGQLVTYDGLDNDVSLPVQLPPFCTDSVVKVFCGDELTLVVTENKRVYMWGTESATGLGATHARDPTNPTGPKEVEGLHDVDLLAAGATHVIALVSHTTADNYDDEAFGYDE